MRLPNLDPQRLPPEQAPLFEKLDEGIRRHLHGFVTHAPDGAVIGPFNAFLHFPRFGEPSWDVFLALAGNSTLPGPVREIAILVTGARNSALYELYSHEALAPMRGLSAAKIATIAAGQRPADLNPAEGIGYDLAYVLNRGARVPESTYRAAHTAFGIDGVAEIAYLVGFYGLICALLNMFDVNVPGAEVGEG